MDPIPSWPTPTIDVSICPVCGSDTLASEGFLEDDGYVREQVMCHQCKAEWLNIYVANQQIITVNPSNTAPKEK